MTRVAILGSRDLACQIARHLSRDPAVSVVGFLDDFRQRGEVTPWGPVLGGIDDAAGLRRAAGVDAVILGIGYKHMDVRARLLAALDGRVPLLSWRHPTAWVDPGAKVGEGVFISPACVVDADVELGRGTFLNVACVISHDSIVGENCFLGPGVTIAGFTHVGAGCFLGTRTVVIDNVRVGAGVVTGAGAVVVEPIADPGLYVGVPARKIR